MKIIDCQQGSQQWYNSRMGVITASEADCIVSPTGKIRTGQGADSYLCKKLAEKLLNYSPEQLDGFAITQGKLIETICLPWYAFEYNCKPKQVGFCLSDDGKTGCSPDALLEDGSGLECKSPQPPNHIKYLLAGEVPEEYRVQCQFSLWVTQAPYWTFVSYSMRLPALVVRVEPDAKIQAAITEAVSNFNAAFDAALAKLST